MTRTSNGELVLAIYPFTRGYAFVLFEGPQSPFDWGICEIKEKHRNVKSITGIKELIDRYRPETILIEDDTDPSARRSSRIKKLYRLIRHLASAEYVDLVLIPTSDVKAYFDLVGTKTKFEMAHAIAQQIPAFAPRLPRYRKAWMSADPRQSLFDAAALGIVYFGGQNIPSPFQFPSNAPDNLPVQAL